METNRIHALLHGGKKGILSVYFTAGYPCLEDTVQVLETLQSRGVDMVEIGIPFSDPMADGPIIQQSSTVALRNGMTLRVLFDQLKNVRERITMPLVLMGYLNPIMQFGFECFCQACRETGIDGVIIPDLPFGDYMEKGYKEIADRYGVRIIMLITPETSDKRIRKIDAHTDGFIYVVSSAATTGVQQSFDEEKRAYFGRVREMGLKNPCLVGFGISNKETFDVAREYTAGGIVGSKFVGLLGTEPGIPEAVDRLLEVLRG